MAEVIQIATFKLQQLLSGIDLVSVPLCQVSTLQTTLKRENTIHALRYL